MRSLCCMGAPVDAVVVSYNSRDKLRACVQPLCELSDVHVIVVDNDSPDRSLETIADLPVLGLQQSENGGFARGVNAGWRAGSARYVLLLNPDAELDHASLETLVERLDGDASLGAVAPRIVGAGGSTDHSLRNFPRLRSTYAQVFFLHRLFPRASWVDELIRDERAYVNPWRPDWVSGACVLVRREALELLGGLDEQFFMYCEDKDLCRRLKDEGYGVLYEPAATCRHAGGGSGDRSSLLKVLAESRIKYARKHSSRLVAALERLGIALGACTRIVVSRGGFHRRSGHLGAMLAALRTRPT